MAPMTRRDPIKSPVRELPSREPNPWLEVSVKGHMRPYLDCGCAYGILLRP